MQSKKSLWNIIVLSDILQRFLVYRKIYNVKRTFRCYYMR